MLLCVPYSTFFTNISRPEYIDIWCVQFELCSPQKRNREKATSHCSVIPRRKISDADTPNTETYFRGYDDDNKECNKCNTLQGGKNKSLVIRQANFVMKTLPVWSICKSKSSNFLWFPTCWPSLSLSTRQNRCLE